MIEPLDQYIPGLHDTLRNALMEDIGTGDITTLCTIPKDRTASAMVNVRTEAVIAGLPIVQQIYHQIDAGVTCTAHFIDGSHVEAGSTVMTIEGSARSILTGERVALNFLQRLSGIATLTQQYVKCIDHTNAKIVDTRKTTPGLRLLEKYAVRIGGGHSHRMGLYDAVLIKDNHISVSGSITAAIKTARANMSHTMTLTVECDSLKQVEEALYARADIILLDNMSCEQLQVAVRLNNRRAVLEASGGITLETAGKIAETGVDILSVGALTHSAKSIDIALDISING